MRLFSVCFGISLYRYNTYEMVCEIQAHFFSINLQADEGDDTACSYNSIVYFIIMSTFSHEIDEILMNIQSLGFFSLCMPDHSRCGSSCVQNWVEISCETVLITATRFSVSIEDGKI